jgi:hypothetical protein
MGITIYDDYLVLFCDVHIIFVTKYKAKFWSLVTYDEDKHLVIECYHSMTKMSSVTRKRSRKIIFLLVILEYELKLENKDPLLVAFGKTNPQAKKPCMSSRALFLSGKSC